MNLHGKESVVIGTYLKDQLGSQDALVQRVRQSFFDFTSAVKDLGMKGLIVSMGQQALEIGTVTPVGFDSEQKGRLVALENEHLDSIRDLVEGRQLKSFGTYHVSEVARDDYEGTMIALGRNVIQLSFENPTP